MVRKNILAIFWPHNGQSPRRQKDIRKIVAPKTAAFGRNSITVQIQGWLKVSYLISLVVEWTDCASPGCGFKPRRALFLVYENIVSVFALLRVLFKRVNPRRRGRIFATPSTFCAFFWSPNTLPGVCLGIWLNGHRLGDEGTKNLDAKSTFNKVRSAHEKYLQQGRNFNKLGPSTS